MNVLTDSTTGTRYLKNYGRNSSVNNATVSASNHIYHDGVTHSTPCGIVHTLGSELYSSRSVGGNLTLVGNTITSSGGGSATGGSILLTISTPPTTGQIFKVEFSVSNITGIPLVSGYHNGVTGILFDTPISLVNGTNVFEVEGRVGTSNVQLYMDTTLTFNYDQTLETIKEITLPAASYFHYYDTASKSIKQLSSTGDVGENIISDFSNVTLDWTHINLTYSVLSGAITNTNTSSYGYMYTSILTEPGKTYKFYVNTSNIDGVISYYKFGTTANGNQIAEYSESTAGIKEYYFKAETITTYITLVNSVNVGETITYQGDISVVESEPISTTYPLTSSYQYAIAATAPLTVADTAYIDANPEAMYRVLYDSLVLPSGFSSTDITHFYDGTGGLVGNKYVQDIATALGSEIIVNGTFNTDLSSWVNVQSKATWESGAARMNDGIDTGTSQLAQSAFAANIYYLISFEIVATGTMGTVKVQNGLSTIDSGVKTAIGTYSFIGITTNTLSGNDTLYVNAENGWDGLIDNVSVKEASASEIANYTSNCRTNFLNTTYGATNLKLVKDASGRTTGVATAAQTYWDSDSRQAVTNWTITAPFTVTEECDGVTYTFTSDGNRYADGVADGTYTLPTGTWTLDDTAFDNVTSVSVRGNAQMIDEVVIP